MVGGETKKKNEIMEQKGYPSDSAAPTAGEGGTRTQPSLFLQTRGGLKK